MPRQARLNVLTVAGLLLCLTAMVLTTVMSTAVAQEKPTASAESMAKLIVFYRTPRDPAEFDRYYAQVHIPLAKKNSGVTPT